MPQFNVRSMLLWVASLAASLAILQIAWRHESVLALLVGAALVGATICAPIGFALRGKTGLRRGIVLGAMIGSLMVCVPVAWSMWYFMFHFF